MSRGAFIGWQGSRNLVNRSHCLRISNVNRVLRALFSLGLEKIRLRAMRCKHLAVHLVCIEVSWEWFLLWFLYELLNIANFLGFGERLSEHFVALLCETWWMASLLRWAVLLRLRGWECLLPDLVTVCLFIRVGTLLHFHNGTLCRVDSKDLLLSWDLWEIVLSLARVAA